MKRDPRSNEAALKYLLIGAASSAIFLYGSSLLYGLSGGLTNINDISLSINLGEGLESLGLAIALVFMIAGIAFKISAVPFHQWTPDVYEGSPTPVVAFLSVGSKAAGFALANRLLATVFNPVSEQWHFIFTALAILSMVLGNVVALAQTSMKRMLAYSSIGQAGFVMIGLVANTTAGYSSMIFYLFIYLFMNLGAFACVILFSLRTGTDKISGYAGLYGLVLIALITSVISIYYYIRVVKMMVVKEPHEMSDVVKDYPVVRWNLPGMRPIQISIIFLLIVTSVLGILSNSVVTIANQSVDSSSVLEATLTAGKINTNIERVSVTEVKTVL